MMGVVQMGADKGRETDMKAVNGALRWAVSGAHNLHYVKFSLCHIAR